MIRRCLAASAVILVLGAISAMAAPGDYRELGSGWDDTAAMAGMDGYLWIVEGGRLYKVDKTGKHTKLSAGWDDTAAMAGMDGHLWIVEGGKLYRVDKAGEYTEISAGWDDTYAMAAMGGSSGSSQRHSLQGRQGR